MANKNFVSKSFLAQLKKDYTASVTSRRSIIKYASDILTASKQAIFSLHRNDPKRAKELLEQASKGLNLIGSDVIANDKQNYEGSLRAALEEYLEASMYYQYVVEGQIDAVKKVKVPFDHELYIGALSDVTGELVRRAIAAATVRDRKEVETIKLVIEEIVGTFMEFDLQSHLRNKYDQAKKNLRSIEEILYELSLTR